jgi:hypothetical protein
MGSLSASDLNLLLKWSIHREAEQSLLAHGRNSAMGQEPTLHNHPGILSSV